MKRIQSFSNIKKTFIFSLLIFVAAGIFGCDMSFSSMEYKRGEKAEKNGEFASAIEHFGKVVSRQPDSPLALTAAREAARLASYETKNFPAALTFLNHIVRFSSSERERRESQESIASIYLEKVLDYKSAIREYNKLVVLRNDAGKLALYRESLAKAHFNLNQFQDARNEIEAAINLVSDADRRFEMLLYKGNILYNMKELDLAIEVFNGLIKENPKRSSKENILMNVIVCYEELEKYDQAIAKLEELRATYPDQSFIDLKIDRLKERKANMPLSRGMRK